MRSTVAILVLLASAFPFPALAEPGGTAVDRVEPNGKWIVDWDTKGCTAQRPYNDGGKLLTFVIKASARSGSFQIYLHRPGGFHYAEEHKREVRFGDAAPDQLEWLDYGVGKASLKMATLNPEQAARFVRSTQVTVDAGTGVKTYVLGPIDQVVKSLEGCRTDLINLWGSAASEAEKASGSLGRRADADLRRLFSSWDYPAQALAANATGIVELTLLIDETGKVADCAIERTSGYALLDAQSCTVLKERARFKPALDKDGRPTKDIAAQKINWRMF